MATEWKIEAKGPKAKIIANCPICHSGTTIAADENLSLEADLHRMLGERFQHGGCNQLVERVPAEVWEKYLKARGA